MLNKFKFYIADKVVKLCIHIKDTVKELHSLGIVISDFNDQNILFDKITMKTYFIDIDSFSVDKYYGDVVMDQFRDPNLRGNNFSFDTDYWAFSIIIYRLLRRVHPFGGIYTKDENMDLTTRMKNGISIIDNKEVKLPKVALPFDELSDNLKESFRRIFVKGERFLIDEELEEILNAKGISKISSPLSKPKMIQTTGKEAIPITIVEQGDDIEVQTYQHGMFVYKKNNKMIIGDKEFDFVPNNKFFVVNDFLVTDTDTNFTIAGNIIQKYPNRSIIIRDKSIFYLSDTLDLIRLDIRNDNGVMSCMQTPLGTLSKHSQFEVSADGKHFFTISTSIIKKILNLNGKIFELNESFAIKEWGLHHDPVGNWLFVCKDETNLFRMFIFEEKTGKILFRDNKFSFSTKLSNLAIYADCIYSVRENLLTIFNWKKNIIKEATFDNIINVDSKVYRDATSLYIINKNAVVKLG